MKKVAAALWMVLSASSAYANEASATPETPEAGTHGPVAPATEAVPAEAASAESSEPEAQSSEPAPAPAPVPSEAVAQPTEMAPAPVMEPVPDVTSSGTSATLGQTTPEIPENVPPTLLGRFKGSQLSMASFVGVGTFVTHEHSDNPYIATTLTLSPRFKLAEKQSLMAELSFGFEHTQPDNPTGRRFAPGDALLGYSYSELLKVDEIGLSVGASGRLILPTSYESQFNGTIVNTAVGVSVAGTYFQDRLKVSWAPSFTKYFPKSATRGLQREDDSIAGAPLPSAYCRGESAFCSGGPLNANYGFANTFRVNYQLVKDLTVEAFFQIRNIYKFSVREEFSDPNLPRTGRTDTTYGGVSLGYSFAERYSVSFGFSSLQPALTADSSSLRFPFYDFTSPANNHTAWSVSLAVAL